MAKTTIYCPICKREISQPIEQIGGPQYPPICISCYLDGLIWAVEDKTILDLLVHGYTLNEATDAYAHNLVLTKTSDDLIKFTDEQIEKWRILK